MKQEFHLTTLKQAKHSPENILRMLSPLERDILYALYSSNSALSTKAIQKKIALSTILSQINDGINAKATLGLIAAALTTLDNDTFLMWLKVVQSNLEAERDPFTDVPIDKFGTQVGNMTVEKVLKVARESKIEVPSHITISTHLSSLCESGFVGKRALGEGKRIEALYFLSPVFYELAQKSKVFEEKAK